MLGKFVFKAYLGVDVVQSGLHNPHLSIPAHWKVLVGAHPCCPSRRRPPCVRPALLILRQPHAAVAVRARDRLLHVAHVVYGLQPGELTGKAALSR